MWRRRDWFTCITYNEEGTSSLTTIHVAYKHHDFITQSYPIINPKTVRYIWKRSSGIACFTTDVKIIFRRVLKIAKNHN
jgi:hypothetical protein